MFDPSIVQNLQHALVPPVVDPPAIYRDWTSAPAFRGQQALAPWTAQQEVQGREWLAPGLMAASAARLDAAMAPPAPAAPAPVP